MFCKNCGKEIDDKAVVCIHCGNAVTPRKKKNILKKWWFWLIIAVAVIAIFAGGESDDKAPTSQSTSVGTETSGDLQNNTVQTPEKEEIVYEAVDLKTMFNDLESNAMKAEATYQNKYIEVTGEISNFVSDGDYISIKVVGGDVWDFNTMMCYIKKDEHRQLLLEKSIGDTVTVKGKVKSIGELLGYTINVDYIQ